MLDPIHVAVAKEEGPMTRMGALPRLSAETMAHALILKVAEDVAKGDPEVLERWRVVFLTTSFVFRQVDDPEDRYWMSVSLREDVVGEFNSVALTPLQKICQIVTAKQRLDDVAGRVLSNTEAAEQYNTRARVAADSEPVSDKLVEAAGIVWRRAFHIEAILTKVIFLEETFGQGTPLDSIMKMRSIIGRCATEEDVTWVFAAIYDGFRSAEIDKGALSTRAIEPSGGKGFVELLLFKKEMMVYLTGSYARELKVPGEVVTAMSTLTKSHDDYRNGVGWPNSDHDLSWMSKFTASAKTYVKLVEDNHEVDMHLA